MCVVEIQLIGEKVLWNRTRSLGLLLAAVVVFGTSGDVGAATADQTSRRGILCRTFRGPGPKSSSGSGLGVQLRGAVASAVREVVEVSAGGRIHFWDPSHHELLSGPRGRQLNQQNLELRAVRCTRTPPTGHRNRLCSSSKHGQKQQKLNNSGPRGGKPLGPAHVQEQQSDVRLFHKAARPLSGIRG